MICICGHTSGAHAGSLGEGPCYGAASAGGCPCVEFLGATEPTLRDKLAMAALSGCVAGGWAPSDIPAFAKQVYAMADAMLAERKPK